MQRPSCLFSLTPVVQFCALFYVHCHSQPIPTRGYLAVALTSPSLPSWGGETSQDLISWRGRFCHCLQGGGGGSSRRPSLSSFLQQERSKFQRSLGECRSGLSPFPELHIFGRPRGAGSAVRARNFVLKTQFPVLFSGRLDGSLGGHPGSDWRTFRTPFSFS